MSFRPFLISSDGHDRCLTCLGRKHAEAAFVDGSCVHCERMPMATLRGCLCLGSSAALVKSKGDLRITVQNAPLNPPLVVPSSCRTRAPVLLVRTSLAMSIAASEEGLTPDEADESRCTCARKMPPPGGIVLVSRPRLAASALHAMAILQVHQAKALKQLHQGGSDPRLMQELRTATDFALRATKVMSTMVVQERHLWLNLAQMSDADKVRFLDAPISQAGLFGDTEGVTSLLPPTSGSLGLWPRAVTLSDVLPPQVLSRSLSSREPGVKVGAACRSVTLLQNASSSGLPHRGYVSDCSLDPTCSESGGVVIAPQPVSLVDPDSPARLYNPIQTAPAQIQRCLCSACGDCGSSGEERNRAGPSSRDE
ncbi:hypothetical protein M9458_008799, partial [Cirrhinus mrigala]